MASVSDIREALCAARLPWFASRHEGCGFYVLFLKRTHRIPPLVLPDDGILYVGMTRAGFSGRDHFTPRSGHSGFCTVRRSLGALLKDELKLTAVPRSSKSDERSFTNYRFTADGEIRLSKWMMGALYVARVPFGENVCAAEAVLINVLAPPLNLKGWENPQATHVKARRRDCANEARSSSAAHRVA